MQNGNIVSESLEHLEIFVVKVLDYIHKINKTKNVSLKLGKEISQERPLTIDEFDEDAKQVVRVGNLNKNVTFDTLVLEHKELILNWLDKFEKKTMYPEGLALSNKLGILAYGPPGSGKTGCMIATANKLGKSILLIHTLCLKNNMLKQIKGIINNYINTHIIVFEEFDYILNSNQIDSQKSELDDEIENCKQILCNSTTAEEKKNMVNKIKELKKQQKTSCEIDIRFILTLLDGVESSEGRLIFANTNNPHKINSLYTRPGRFDVVVKLGFCTLDMFKQLVLKKYKTLQNDFFENNDNKINKILTLNITPLVLINKLVISQNENELLDELLTLKQSYYNFEPCH
jgi:SpoVK/Ycf46/Vps4 family AAA+-type ATPase